MTRESPETAPVRSGAEHRAKGDFAAAESLLRAAVAAAEVSDPPNATRLAEALNELGLLCKDLAKYDEARALYERALSLLEGTSEPNPAHLASLYHNLGGIEHARGNNAVGETLARRGLELRRRIPRADRREIAADRSALAALLDAQDKHLEAEELYLEALAVFEEEEVAGEIAVVLNGLGALHVRRGDLEAGIALLERAASVKREVLGPGHPDLAVTLNNLAVACRRRGDLARAAALYAESLHIFEHSLGAEHPKTISCRANAARNAGAVPTSPSSETRSGEPSDSET